MHILVVDDDVDIRDTLQMALETEGYDVRTAANGAEALESVHADPPALILLDVMMPVMGGAEFMEHLRTEAELDPVPVLVVTAWPKEAVALRGVQGVLAKPLDIDDLFAQVARFTPPPRAAAP